MISPNVPAIVALGHHQPAHVVSNDHLAVRLATSDEWIRRRVGITSRRLAGSEESVADMAGSAATRALVKSRVDVADIDLIAVATCTAIDRMPNTASRVARQLGVPRAAAFDVNVACSGFSYALALTEHALSSGSARHAIVIGADKMSDFVDWTDRSTCVLFGDGAGAAIVSLVNRRSRRIGQVTWGSDPTMGSMITLEGELAADNPVFRQNGQAVYRWATHSLVPVALEACKNADIHPSELAGIVTHQANLRIIDAIVDKLGAPNAVIARDVAVSGNTSAASIPLAFSKLSERGEVATGSPVLLLGFGAGLTYGAQVVVCP